MGRFVILCKLCKRTAASTMKRRNQISILRKIKNQRHIHEHQFLRPKPVITATDFKFSGVITDDDQMISFDPNDPAWAELRKNPKRRLLRLKSSSSTQPETDNSKASTSGTSDDIRPNGTLLRKTNSTSLKDNFFFKMPKTYKCLLCIKVFYHLKQLKKHIRKHRKSHKCPKCNEYYT